MAEGQGSKNNFNNRNSTGDSNDEDIIREFKKYCDNIEKQGYWKEENGKKYLNANYIVEYAITVSKALGSTNANKRSQIRKYYDHCIRVKSKIEKKGFNENEADLCMILPLVNDAFATDKVTNEFKVFIEENINYIRKEDSNEKEKEEKFMAFMKHFQAVIAYTR